MKPSLKDKLKQALAKSKGQPTETDAGPKKANAKPKALPVPTSLAKTTSRDALVAKNKKEKGLSKLQEKMAKKLSGSKFRWINESLYTTESDKSFRLFKEQPELFDIYHQGFQSQVEEWPVNPVDIFIKYLGDKPKETVVADLGCGVAQIAQQLHQSLTVHSFDLIKGNRFITACDIAHVPLATASVDVAVFALSLMGTNFVDFLKEANRILKDGAELKIAEVVSRIESLADFIRGVEGIGFKLTNKDTSNKMFVLLDFVKADQATAAGLGPHQGPILKPCIYKRR
ncbi:25S rRNA (adenine645-N1)-methyltransferase [Kappamyces sp. JEL0829]|nr:25S rRNA (adenine645-N1)-methyltransferase [Kappamyces sp. JEL0829]